MPEQLGLFAPRRAAPPAECPRFPGGGYMLCRDGREGRCPGGPRCEALGEQETERIRAAEAERGGGSVGAASAAGGGGPNARGDGGAGPLASVRRTSGAGEQHSPGEPACGACGSTTGAGALRARSARRESMLLELRQAGAGGTMTITRDDLAREYQRGAKDGEAKAREEMEALGPGLRQVVALHRALGHFEAREFTSLVNTLVAAGLIRAGSTQ